LTADFRRRSSRRHITRLTRKQDIASCLTRLTRHKKPPSGTFSIPGKGGRHKLLFLSLIPCVLLSFLTCTRYHDSRCRLPSSRPTPRTTHHDHLAVIQASASRLANIIPRFGTRSCEIAGCRLGVGDADSGSGFVGRS
jgi:hypothetical protein